ncbi:hypothetical protein MD484_g2014, partial [Candolleomyces efflorescens]
MLLDIQSLVKSNDLLPDDELKELNAQRTLIQEQLDAIQALLARQTLQDGSTPNSSSAPVTPGRRRRKQLLAELSAYDTILAPHKRLPAELLSQIFILAYPDATFIPIQRGCSPVILSHVCSRWRSIALETPELWADLVLRFAAYTLLEPPQAIDVAEEWFRRGGDRIPKSLILIDQLRWSTSKWDKRELLLSVISRLVIPLAPTLGRLQLVVPRTLLRPLFSSTVFPQLRTLWLQFNPDEGDSPFTSHLNVFNKASLPQLVDMKFAEFGDILRPENMLDHLPWGSFTRLNLCGTRFSLDRCHSLLKQCKLVQECELTVSIKWNDSPEPTTQLILPHLRTLSVDFLHSEFTPSSLNGPPNVGSFFLPLVLMGLKTLTVSSIDPGRITRPAWGFERFMRFLAQSGPSLEVFKADLPFTYSTQSAASEVEAIAAALPPTLVELRIPTRLRFGESLSSELVARMREGEVLPNLKLLIGRVEELQVILDLVERRSESSCRLKYVAVDYEGASITAVQAGRIDRLREQGIVIDVNRVH